VESSLRLGNHDLVRKKGFWPAFWMMGSSSQHGVRWPDCGEIDIMENKFDWSEGYGTVHYAKDQYLTGTIETPDHGTDWHTWRVEIDRRSDSFSEQSIVWYLDGKEFHRVRGDTINDEAIWTRVAQSPMFIILNLAVGGKFVSLRK
jgi:beta-glucanase (GH16 family)